MNIAIITPIQVELDAILSKLPAHREEITEGIRYLVAPFKGKHHDFKLVLQLGGPNNENTALATEKVVKKYQPQAVILCGVAGGVKDVQIGDVVVGSKYYGYDFGKVTQEGFKTRPESGYYSRDLFALAQSVAAKGDWRSRASNNKPCKVIFGAIAAGNKVVTASDSAEYRRLKDDFNNTTAVEMEAVGFSQAMLSYPAIQHINIRGISDLLDGKDTADAGGSQVLAADNMAAFVLELVHRLDVSQFKIFGSMNIKELSKEIIKLILPIVKLDEASKTSSGPQNEISETVRELWARTRPLLQGEYEALLQAPNDVDAQADARSELKRALESKGNLRKELEDLVKKAAPKVPYVEMNHSGTGDNVFGNKTEYHYSSETRTME